MANTYDQEATQVSLSAHAPPFNSPTIVEDHLLKDWSVVDNPYSRAPPPTELEHSESSASSMVDVDSPHISSVASDYTVGGDETTRKADEFEEEISHQAEETKRTAKQKFDEVSKDASKNFDKAKKATSKKSGQAKEKASRAGDELRDNKDNPVIIGNAVVICAGSAILGYQAFQKYSAGELNWKIVAAWTGAVGLFAAGDYYLSQYLFKNKYPKK
ncbi:hypothetical protein MMC12_004676 [Toensbergia leucococca]|nr:hypothetical protein [Toensbergia leucococca]